MTQVGSKFDSKSSFWNIQERDWVDLKKIEGKSGEQKKWKERSKSPEEIEEIIKQIKEWTFEARCWLLFDEKH